MKKLDSEHINGFIPDIKIPIRVAFIKPNGAPVVVSLWYVCDDCKIYCAVQKTAKIILYPLKKHVNGIFYFPVVCQDLKDILVENEVENH